MVVSKGSVYVIESTFECPRNGYFSLVLIGVPAAHAHLRGVNAARFRLLDEMKKEAKEVQSKSCEK
jgi:hypothetical protein